MQLRTEVEIAAPRSVVWQILADTSAYHEWNPFITTLEGPMQVGERLTIVVSPPDSSDLRFSPVLVNFDEEQEIRWKGKVIADFLFAGEHFLTLEDVGNGRTRVSHGEDFQGFLLRFMARQMSATARGFALMNQALKRRAETFAHAQGPNHL